MTFALLLSEATASDELPRTGDLLAVGLPLLRQIEALHRSGRVTGASGVSALAYDGETLTISSSQSARENSSARAVAFIEAQGSRGGVAVSAHRRIDTTGDSLWGGVHTSEDVFDSSHGRPDRPMFVLGYQAWEQLLGHHDELTDIALAGLWLSSYAFSLDFATPEGANHLALHYRHPSRLNGALHPVVLGVLADMVEPSRSKRAADISHIIARLEHHRDLPADLDLSAAYLPDTDWRRAVLATLRDRVFDTTRRNRELYYRPTASSVSLTESSVPLLLDAKRIGAKDLLTWTEPSNKSLRSGKAVDLEKWCRFEETAYLAPTLDKLISAERKVRVESGHGRLRLIIAFLNWQDPETGETIVSPLLSVPVLLSRKKGVKNRYLLELADDDATVNPILRHVFKSRFDIRMPTAVDTDPDSIRAFVADLEAGVQATAPAVSIELIEKPRIELLRQKAQLRLDTYRRRRAKNLASSGRWRRQDHSFDHDDWRPLGQALYQRFVLPEDLPMRDIAGAPPRARRHHLNEPEETKLGERSNQSYSTKNVDVSAERWEADLCAVTLAMLGSRRTNLARDYDAVLGDSPVDITTTPFEPLFSPEPTSTPPAPTVPMNVNQRLVLPADDAQARAVQRAVRGDSLIIQGPPGTGKSQTITNVIAALVAEGKRVLFVCEKRAAIDVVAQRLDKVGLGGLTATIHDSQLDRKTFVKELGDTYIEWLDSDENAPDPDARRTELLADIANAMRPLETVSNELGRSIGGGLSISDAVERVATLQTGSVEGDVAPTAIPIERWMALRPTLDRVVDALVAGGQSAIPGDHAALRLRPSLLQNVDVVSLARSAGSELAAARDLVIDSGDQLGQIDAAELAALDSYVDVMRQANAVGTLGAMDPTSPQHLDLRSASAELEKLRQAAASSSEVLERWSTPLAEADTAAGLALAAEKEGSLFKFLNSRWRALKSLVDASYKFDTHQVRPTVTVVLAELDAYHQAQRAVSEAEASGQARYGSPDITALRGVADTHHKHKIYSALVHAEKDFDDLASRFERLNEALRVVLVLDGQTIDEFGEIARGLAATPVALEPALLAWSSVDETIEADLLAILSNVSSMDTTEAAIITNALNEWTSSIDHPSFSGARIDEAVATVSDLYRELCSVNADVALAAARGRFLDNIEHSEASMAGRSDEDKEHKRSYNAGRRIVEREHEKKMRHRSIREMASGESGMLVRDLRPVWLMSPLSVSDTLPLASELFDVVIFDEASQIPVEDAIPSILRSPQLIVVGDRMQMPPTRFFSSDDDDEMDVVVDEHGFRLSISLDADSFLTQADGALSSSMLNWHYRSRFESLISYSNHAFYAGRLATVPDTQLSEGARTEIVVDSADSGADNAAETLDRPISYHFLEHGEYRDRRNVPEADYIAEMVRSILRREDGLTIGIVAFSEAQQSAIEDSLTELAAIDPEFSERYESELQRFEDEEFAGLFIKNLENVQGDERDLIIMSVCYGPDPNGQIKMNFGPINNAGGERRLNVIFSRAKQHMAVVASMHGADITNLHNEGASHLAGFLRYAHAESIGDDGVALALLDGMSPNEEAMAARNQVAEDIAAALAIRGWLVETAVGRSAFRIDVALTSNDDEQRLGVLLEPGDTSGPHARYVAEAGVLEEFGWRIIRVPLSDWWADSDRVIERIEAAV